MKGVSLAGRLRQQPPLLTIFSIIPRPEIVELIALAGFDAVILDMEHGPVGFESLGSLILAARARGIYAIVRVSSAEASLIGAALDAGADGVLVPQVGSLDAAKAVVEAARFAPLGARGLNPWVRAADYDSGPDWLVQANQEVAVLVMIEGKGGVDALSDILDLAGLDGVFLGPVDLSQSLGVGGQPKHPRVLELMDRVAKEAAAKGKAVGAFAPDPSSARQRLAESFNLVAVAMDSVTILRALRGLAVDARAEVAVSCRPF